MEPLIQFGGRLHPLLVHLPIGIIFLIVLLEVAALFQRRKAGSTLPAQVRSIRPILLVVLAISALFAAGGGWLLSLDGGYNEDILGRHRFAGFAVAGLSIALLLTFRRSWLYASALSLGLAGVMVAGHYGGVLTHGSGYLTKPLQAFFAPPEPAQAVAMQSLPVEPEPLVFNHVILPVLEESCISCHGPEKKKGRLRLDSWDAIAAGGKNGPALVAASPQESEMIRRLRLPLEHDDHMPPEGKPQPTLHEIQLLEWWIAHGASPAATLADLPPPPTDAGLPALLAAAPSTPPPALPQREEILPLVENASGETGVIINYLHPEEPWIEVVARYQGDQFDDAAIQHLLPLSELIMRLDLGKTGITDAALQTVAQMQNLRSLKLDHTNITDEGLRHLQDLNRLEFLNLVGAPITDDGLPALQSISSLRSVHLWQTQTSIEAVAALEDALTNEDLVNQLRAQLLDLQERLSAQIPNIQTGGFEAPDVEPEVLEVE